MTYLAQTAGRPINQEEVGRDLIVRRTRAALRDQPRADLSRQDIAKYAGVTPALTSYYFPDRSSLFEAVATPIIEDHAESVRRVINSDQSLDEKLKSIIEVYLAFCCSEGYLLDFYIQFAKSGKNVNLSLLADIQEAVVALVGKLLDRQCILGECPSEVQSTLWGMCKQVARRSGNERMTGPSINERIATESALLYDFFMNGVAIVLPVGSMLHTSQA